MITSLANDPTPDARAPHPLTLRPLLHGLYVLSFGGAHTPPQEKKKTAPFDSVRSAASTQKY